MVGHAISFRPFSETTTIVNINMFYLFGNQIFLKSSQYTDLKFFLHKQSVLAFPTGRDSATFRDKGTEVPSLSRDKGTTGQAQNLATGRDGILTACPVPSRDVPRDRNERKSVEKIGFMGTTN